MTIGAIILAAGSGRRMGGDKLLADLGGRPMVRHVVDAVEAAGLPVPLVAVPEGAEALVAALGAHALPVPVKGHEEGMARSLATAVLAIPDDWRGVLICLGDMPFVGARQLCELAARVAEGSIVTPMFEGRRGNPVAWGRAFFGDLAKIDGDQGGKSLFDQYAGRVVSFECGDRGVLIDVDTPQALADARKWLR